MYKILFVCLGNICRSPAAECLFQHMVEQKGLDKKILTDSCGTSGHHEGESSDIRMQTHAEKRGYKISCQSRGFKGLSDFENFDLIVTMDDQNYSDIINWPSVGPKFSNKVVKFVDYCKKTKPTEVADPYFGGPSGFEAALDTIEEGCLELLELVSKKL